MKNTLIKTALRQNAFYIPKEWISESASKEWSQPTAAFVVECSKLGFTFSEELLRVLNGISPMQKMELLNVLREVTGADSNWTPLLKQWNIPTGENVMDHIKTFFANLFPNQEGTRLACGHLIPKNTFPLERYNGCPFCGMAFDTNELVLEATKNKLRVLELWTEADLEKYMHSLLQSPVALDATQGESLKTLLGTFELPAAIEIKMKETSMLVIGALVAQNKLEAAARFFKSPSDVLRYLWFQHTGFLQIVEPKTIIKRMAQNARNRRTQTDASQSVKIKSAKDLKLKFSRAECRMYATWLNNLEMEVTQQCEAMHPKRELWVRVIRALRLAEYSKRKGFENLYKLLDTFYRKEYTVWQGRVNHFKLKNDASQTFNLLKQRPGLFARALFSSMLWFGKDETITHFKEVIDQVPARLVFTLNMYAENYFSKNATRAVKPLGGTNKTVPAHPLLKLYEDKDLAAMRSAVQELSLMSIRKNLVAQKNENHTIFIDPDLFNIPIAIGDRNEQIQDLPDALMGTRFPVEGDTVRLFLQWGKGLPAQHLDMDLSCSVAYEERSEFCSYSRLTIAGCQHSGDIQQIPNKVGTAEYIDINLKELNQLGAKYVTFTCNAFTNGSLSPNLVVGWMNSKHPMKISKSGVAYHPADVQHQVRIKQTLTKGMVFGVLDVEARSITWLEMAFGGQVVQNMNFENVEALLQKLEAKLKIGDLLRLKAECQELNVVQNASAADEVYDMKWALDSAAVSQLFLGK